MAKELSQYQKGVIKRYYDNLGNISAQKLGELVSDLYLAKDKTNIKNMWKAAETALGNLGVKPDRIKKVVDAKDLEALASLVGELF